MMTDKDDKDKYVEDLRNRVEAEARRNEVELENFLKAENSADYKAALKKISVLKGENAVNKGLTLMRDQQADTEVRILALKKLVTAMGNDPNFVMTCLKLLEDTTNEPALRKTAFDVLKTLSFSSKQFAAIRADYMAVLRKLLDEPDLNLRETAAEDLAVNKDEYVQRRLLDELKNKDENIVKRAKAIQLLGYDMHAEHYPVVREILQETTSSEVEKVEAIHVLGNDPSSKELLKSLMQDKKQEKEVRLSSASALQALQPEEFIAAAKGIVLNEKEDKDMRVLCLNGMMPHLESSSLRDDQEFIQRVSNIRTLSPALKRVSRKFREDMQRKKKK